MAIKTFRLIGFDEGGVNQKQDNENLRLVCLLEGGGKLAVWGKVGSQKNIDLVMRAGIPCSIECDCIPPSAWAIRYGHTSWLPQGNTIRVFSDDRQSLKG
jgi:hypothetical protein